MESVRQLIRRLFRTVVPNPYIIVHDPRYGYAACFLEYGNYYTITKHGTTSVTIDTAKDPFYGNGCWVATEDEAGARINFHCDGSGQRVIWP